MTNLPPGYSLFKKNGKLVQKRKNPPSYWIVKKHGDLIVRYNKELDRFGWDRLKEIVSATVLSCDVWDSPGAHKAHVDDLDGVMCFGIQAIHPCGKILVCIETKEGLEKVLGVRLSELAEYNLVSDGQHKHGKKQITIPPVKKLILEKRAKNTKQLMLEQRAKNKK